MPRRLRFTVDPGVRGEAGASPTFRADDNVAGNALGRQPTPQDQWAFQARWPLAPEQEPTRARRARLHGRWLREHDVSPLAVPQTGSRGTERPPRPPRRSCVSDVRGVA